MALIVIFDENSAPQKGLEIIPSVNTPDYEKRTDVLINPDLEAVKGISPKYLKHDKGKIVQMTEAEKTAQDTADLNTEKQNRRSAADTTLDSKDELGMVMRAFMEIVLNEINLLRDQAGLTPRTGAQLKTAIKNKISSGDVD